MSVTRLAVQRDPHGGRARVTVSTDGPRGRGHLTFRLLDVGPHHARVAVVAEGALLLAGDDVGLKVEAGPGTALDVVEPSGTVAYDMRGGSARWIVELDVADGAVVRWPGQPVVIADGARVHRTVTVRLEGTARADLRETLVLGRAGERGGILRQRTRVTDDAGPVLAEDLLLDGAAPRTGVVGGHRVVDTVTLLGHRACGGAMPTGVHRLDLERAGTVLRHLGAAAHESPLDAVWSSLLRTTGVAA